MTHTWIAAIVIVLVIIILWYRNIQAQRTAITSYMNGFWVADDQICKLSGIDGMFLYINDEGAAYLLMYSGNDILMEKRLQLSRKSYLWPKFGHEYECYYEISDDDNEIPIDDFMCGNMRIILNLCDNTMHWHGPDDQLYLKAYKHTLGDVMDDGGGGESIAGLLDTGGGAVETEADINEEYENEDRVLP